ncbi:MAG: PAS domain-containing protein, partial [Alphaproteobacteria bacterium]
MLPLLKTATGIGAGVLLVLAVLSALPGGGPVPPLLAVPALAVAAVAHIVVLHLSLLRERRECLRLETEQRRLSQALGASDQRVRDITDAIPGLIAYIDRNHRFRFCNRHFQDWFGHDPMSLVGRPIGEVLDDNYSNFLPMIDEALDGREVTYETQARMRHRDRRVLSHYVPHRENGVVVGFFSLMLDVTDRKILEDDLRRSQDTLRVRAVEAETTLKAAVESLPQGLLLWDRNDRLAVHNQEFTRLFPGLTRFLTPDISFAEFVTHAVEETLAGATLPFSSGPVGTIDPSDQRFQDAVALRVERHRNPPSVFELKLPSGLWVLVSERKTRDGWVVGTYTDITRLKSVENELRETQAL